MPEPSLTPGGGDPDQYKSHWNMPKSVVVLLGIPFVVLGIQGLITRRIVDILNTMDHSNCNFLTEWIYGEGVCELHMINIVYLESLSSLTFEQQMEINAFYINVSLVLGLGLFIVFCGLFFCGDK